MKTFESWILEYLLNSLWQVPLLYLTAWLAARIVRASDAALEHRVWVTALVLQTLLPACSAQPWQWLRWLSWTWRASSKTRRGEVSIIVGPGVGLGTLHFPSSLLTVFVTAYLAVILYFTIRLLWGIWRTYELRRGSTPVTLTREASLTWAGSSMRFGVHNATLAASREILGPLTIGIRRRIILLPATMVTSLPDAELQTILAHEFAHISRHDFTKNLLYEFLALPMIYHPLFWVTRANVIESREILCDQMAADVVDGPESYARSLLRLASLLVQPKPTDALHAIGIFDANAFERRIMKLTTKQQPVPSVLRAITVAACIAFGLGTCASALALRAAVYLPSVQNETSTPGKPLAIKVPAEVMARNTLTKVVPTYPPAAKDAKIQGVVSLRAIIGKDGSVENLVIVSGPTELQRSAIDAVRQWVYKPYLLNGNPVEVNTTIEVHYSLVQ